MSTSASAAGDRGRETSGQGTGPRRAGAEPGPDGLRSSGVNDTNRRDVVEREKATFGGVKIGSAFFGWLTAIGTTVLLTALATALGAAVLADTGNPDATALTVTGTIVLLVILFVDYYCGGYVAGMMALFN